MSKTRKLVFCAVAVALAFVTSFIKLFSLPFGGSVTLFSMLFITLIGYWFGWKYGLACGLVYGILNFISEPIALNVFQVCCDYIFAFACLGFSGFFKGKKNGLITGYLVAVIARGFWHSLGGYLYWMEYMPENFPASIKFLYPVVYNYGFLFAEAALTLILLAIPAVRKAIRKVTPVE